MSSTTDISQTIGAIEIGILISIFLFGVVTTQVYVYIHRFPRDSWKLKALVVFLWTCEFVHTVLTVRTLYELTVLDFGEYDVALFKTPTSLNGALMLSGIIGPFVQIFFANRIRILSGNLYIACLCWIMSTIRFISIIGVTVACSLFPLAEFVERFRWLLSTSLVVSAFVDIMIAVFLCYYLRARRGTGVASTTKMVDHLIVWSIQTGLITSMATVAMLICFLTMHNFIWLSIFFVLSRIFSNSFMSSINARRIMRKKMESTFKVVDLHGDASQASSQPTIAIEMTKTTVTSSTMNEYSNGEMNGRHAHKLSDEIYNARKV